MKGKLLDVFHRIPEFSIHQILFCSTQQGKAHMARHFQVTLHIDGL
jgi:hypothetical protein